MSETPAQYETAAQGTTACACGCGLQKRPRSRYATDACRARASRMRRTAGSQPGQIRRAQIIRGGDVSITLHLPPDWQGRIDELVPGAWVHIQTGGQ